MERLSSFDQNEAQRVWEEILSFLKGRITAQAFETWFSDTRAISIQDDRIIVEVPNEFYIDWIDEHYSKVIGEALRNLRKQIKVIYRPAPKREKRRTKHYALVKHPETQLQKRYTFENFVVGKSNEFAYAAAKAVAKSPASEYNPLFIYGGVGLGKTHLLQAIGNHILSTRRELKVFYTPAENFMNEMIRAIQNRRMVSFKLKYRQLDVLLIDDVQFLADKEMLQEEIFHTFNSLYDAGKQIVMTCDRAPKEIPSLEERLVSRFQWGLVVDIKPPDLETRMAILKKKAQDEDLELPNDVIHFIAQKVKTNIRELEGCLIRLSAFHSLTRSPINLEIAEEILRDILKDSNGLDIHDITDAVSQVFGVTERELRSKSRKAEVVMARQVAMYLCRKILGSPLKKIGLYFGGRDHSTVIHSLEKVDKFVEEDVDLREKIEKIEKMLRIS
jgi:chromosomal replication initiator protein